MLRQGELGGPVHQAAQNAALYTGDPAWGCSSSRRPETSSSSGAWDRESSVLLPGEHRPVPWSPGEWASGQPSWGGRTSPPRAQAPASGWFGLRPSQPPAPAWAEQSLRKRPSETRLPEIHTTLGGRACPHSTEEETGSERLRGRYQGHTAHQMEGPPGPRLCMCLPGEGGRLRLCLTSLYMRLGPRVQIKVASLVHRVLDPLVRLPAPRRSKADLRACGCSLAGQAHTLAPPGPEGWHAAEN